MQLCGRTCFFTTVNASTSAQSRLPLLAPKMQFDLPVTAGDTHPLEGSRAIAIATADGFVRLFDLRKLFSSCEIFELLIGVFVDGILLSAAVLVCPRPLFSFSEFVLSFSHYLIATDCQALGDSQLTPCPYQVVRPLGLLSQPNFFRNVRLDYGPLFVTSVRFEPPAPPYPLDIFGHRRQRQRKSRPPVPGRHLLVSHMYSPTFQFDLDNLETKVEEFSANDVSDSCYFFYAQPTSPTAHSLSIFPCITCGCH